MAGYKIAASLGASLILLTACERPSAVASKDEASAASAAPRAAPSEFARADERSAEPVRQIDGKPIWSASRRGSAEENARRSFERNGEAFGARDFDAFVRKTHDFVENPPAGTERLTRANGDVLLYDPKGNVFAVVTETGAPRAMFKPDDGAAYWQEQKTRESRRQTARSNRADRDSGDS
jgi:pyocin large subunit-like protein